MHEPELNRTYAEWATDYGVGILPTPPPKASKEGTGLGLAITKQLVELHRGKIQVASQPGQGSRFSFALPAGPAGAAVAEAVLDMVTALRPDLVFLDIQMLVLDGFSVLRLLKENPCFAGLRVIALAAFAMRGDRGKALAAGFDDYITKPIDAAELERQVQDRLNRRPRECADGG